MKTIFLAALFLASAFGQGSVKVDVSSVGLPQSTGIYTTYAVTYHWTGDQLSGVVPIASASLGNCCQGYIPSQVEVSNGTPQPTAGYSVSITDYAGVDILQGAASTLSPVGSQAFAVSGAATPLLGTLYLNVTGQAVGGATGTVVVFLKQITQNINVTIPTNGTSSVSDNWLTLSNSPFLDPRRFNFSQSPGGSISPNPTIVLKPVPFGVNGTDVAHYLYASGGSGPAETCLITGGTAVSGAAAGTVILNCASSHSGGFSIGSATGGAQEAFQFGGTNAGVWLIPGILQIQAPISFTANSQTLFGAGRNASFIQANFNTGNILVDNGFSYANLHDFGIYRINGYGTAPTSGATIGIFGAAYVQMQNLYLRHNYNAIDTLGACVSGGTLGNCSLVFMRDIILEAVANEGIIGLQGTLDGLYFNANLPGGYTATYTPQDFLLIRFADGTQVSNVVWGGAYSRSTIYFNVPSCTGCRAGLLSFYGMQTDGWIGGPAVLFGGAATFGANTLNFDNCDWSTSGGNTNPVFRVNTELSNISITNSKFVNMTGGVFDGGNDAAGITNLTFSNNQMVGIANGIPVISMDNFGIGVGIWTFTGNNFYTGGGANPTYDMEFLAAASNVNIVNNNFGNYSIAPMHWAVTPSTAVIGMNGFVDDSPISLASASSIALTPGYKNYIITGTTGISTITGLYEGEEVNLLTNGGSIVFTASATVGNTITSTQNVPVVGTVIAGKMYLK